MKVLAISGSLRRDSYNTALLRAARDLAPAGVDVELYDGLGAIPAFDEDLEDDLPAPVLDLARRIAKADAVLIATPEYNGSAPGALKNALDWASRPTGMAPVVGKPAAVIGASIGAFGAKWAQEQIKRALTLSGAMVVDAELAVPKRGAGVENGEPTDEEIREDLIEVLGLLLAVPAQAALAA
jgi:chromate reductase, NAD(P)H dehydrogenase (quinone)